MRTLENPQVSLRPFTDCVVSQASPGFVYEVEMTMALEYGAHWNVPLAIECAWAAFDAALRMKRPDLCYTANELIGMLAGAL